MTTHANNTEMAMTALQKAAQSSLIASPPEALLVAQPAF